MYTENVNQQASSQSSQNSGNLTDQLNKSIEVPKGKLSLLDAINLVERKKELQLKQDLVAIKINNTPSEQTSFEETTITGDVLVSTSHDSIPHLWEPYFPKSAIVGICGASEAGKSTFTRQLALAICNGDSTFLGGKLNLTHKSVIYLSTEDDEISIGVLLKNQTAKKYQNGLKRFRAGLNVTKTTTYLDKELTKQGADLVVIDVWSDVFNDNPNDFTKVRANLRHYANLARKFRTCICIIHHNTKHSEGKDPSKNNLNGSQAIEAKLRTLLELRALTDGQKQLSIIKVNYISYNDKKLRLIIGQGDDLNFNFIKHDETISTCKIKNPKSSNEDIRKRAFELRVQDSLSQDKIVDILKTEFGNDAPSKGTLNKMFNTPKTGQSEV